MTKRGLVARDDLCHKNRAAAGAKELPEHDLTRSKVFGVCVHTGAGVAGWPLTFNSMSQGVAARLTNRGLAVCAHNRADVGEREIVVELFHDGPASCATSTDAIAAKFLAAQCGGIGIHCPVRL